MLLGLLVAFGFGAMHALSPGHGKALPAVRRLSVASAALVLRIGLGLLAETLRQAMP